MRNILKINLAIFTVLILCSCNASQNSLTSASLIRTPVSPLENLAINISPVATVTNQLPVPTLSPSSTSTPSPTFTPIVTSATSTPLPPIVKNPLPEFPLEVGNTWVYSATYYGHTKFDGGLTPVEALTATYIITDQVIITQTVGSLFGAEIRRVSSLIDGAAYNQFHGGDLNWNLEAPFPKVYSYVISGTKVYQQNELDFPNLRAKKSESGPFVYPLVYDFPFVDETGFNCWYSGTSEIGDCRTANWWDGYYYVEEGPIALELTVGSFENCYIISIASRGGGRNQWFCMDVGIVGSEWMYQGQSFGDYPPIGYKIQLLSYSLVK